MIMSVGNTKQKDFRELFMIVLTDYVKWLKDEYNIEFRKCEENEHPQVVDMKQIMDLMGVYELDLQDHATMFNLIFPKKEN